MLCWFNSICRAENHVGIYFRKFSFNTTTIILLILNDIILSKKTSFIKWNSYQENKNTSILKCFNKPYFTNRNKD